jgi:hypothetical protein
MINLFWERSIIKIVQDKAVDWLVCDRTRWTARGSTGIMVDIWSAKINKRYRISCWSAIDFFGEDSQAVNQQRYHQLLINKSNKDIVSLLINNYFGNDQAVGEASSIQLQEWNFTGMRKIQRRYRISCWSTGIFLRGKKHYQDSPSWLACLSSTRIDFTGWKINNCFFFGKEALSR